MSATDGYQRQPDLITTKDGVLVGKGDRVYNYYDYWPGTIVSEPDDQGWFFVRPDQGITHTGRNQALLNGERICSIDYARRRGFRDA